MKLVRTTESTENTEERRHGHNLSVFPCFPCYRVLIELKILNNHNCFLKVPKYQMRCKNKLLKARKTRKKGSTGTVLSVLSVLSVVIAYWLGFSVPAMIQ